MKKPINASSASSIVIVFGRTPESKVARGARFRIEDREKALASAIDRKFDLLMASDDVTRRLAEELAEGHFAVNGRAHLPTIAPALYERLRALAAKMSEDGEGLASAKSPAASKSEAVLSASDVSVAEDGPGSRGSDRPADASEAALQASEPIEAVASAKADENSAPDRGRQERVNRAAGIASEGPDRHEGAAAEANDDDKATKMARADGEPSDAAARAEPSELVVEANLPGVVADPARPEPKRSAENAEPSVPIAGHMAIEGLRAIERQGETSAKQHPNPAIAAATTPAMPQDEPAESAGVIAPAVIVFGRSGIARPRAGWFPMIEAGLARKAAERQTLSSLPIATPDEYRLASQIGRGKLFGHGILTVPATVLALFEKLLQLYERARGERRTELTPDPEPTAPRLPTTWADIGVGSLVLAPEEDDEGWWEAEVLALAGDELALRWRHVPEEAVFVRKLAQIALLSPERPLAV